MSNWKSYGLLALLLMGACNKQAEENPPAETESLPLSAPLGLAPDDPLEGSAVESCALYLEERCEEGVLQSCQVYDLGSSSFPETVEPALNRALLFDRWYDLYHQPHGMTAERYFSSETLAGTPESVWGDPDYFANYAGTGDAAIWTGVALETYALRYLQSGTEADYQRMETKTRQLQTLFDVTGIPGYLAREHFLLTDDPSAPNDDRHFVERNPDSLNHWDHVIDPADAPDLAADYNGFEDASGTFWSASPMWHGNPSIDQYTGPMVAFPLVWPLLRDEALKERMANSLVCYLNRLERIEIINLQSNSEALEAVSSAFGDGVLELDEGDFNVLELDTVVFYALRQPNTLNSASFDSSCPSGPAQTASQTIDVTDSDYLIQLIALATNLASGDLELAEGIDHVYVANLRGGDAFHMMHLSAIAYYMTGETQYRDFLLNTLIGDLETDRVAATAGSLRPPVWCHAHYGLHISFAPLWAFINLLDDSELRTSMQQVMEAEFADKLMYDQENAKFDLMYAGVVPESMGNYREEAVANALTVIETFGGNGGQLDDPRRGYSLDRAVLLEDMPAGVERRCPTEAERAQCEDGFELFGLSIPGEDITSSCTGGPGECPVGDGCAEPMASKAMPMAYRVWEDFIWQRNPFKIGRRFGIEGQKQAPGLDVIEPFWLARTYELVDAGEGQVLAWEVLGDCGG